MNSTQLAQLLKSIADILGLVLLASATFFFQRIKTWIQEHQARKFDLSINKSAKTQFLISELRAITDADRIKVFQLHNGEYFLNGGELMKSSMTHYYVKTGVAIPQLNDNQNIPTSHMSLLFKCMRDNGHCIMSNNPDEIDPAIRRLMSIGGIHTGLVVPMRRLNDAWVGYITIGWLEGGVEITPEIIADSVDYAQQVCDHLCAKK